MKFKFLLPAFFFLFTIGHVQAQYSGSSLNWPTWKYDSLFYKSVANENTLMPYRLLKPLTYVPGNRSVKYPLVIMLHGKGEGMGSSWADNVGINITQLAWGGKMHLDSLSKYPAFYLHPQTFQGGWSSADGSGDYDPEGSRPMRILTELLDSLFRQHPIDIDRVYIHGLSGGGQGVWEMLFRNPALFAATSPHSATGNLNAAQQIVHNPLWVSQGELDTNPRPENAIKMMDSLRKYGVYPIFTWNTTLNKHVWPNLSTVDGNPIYSSNPNLAHVAWIDLYNSPVWLKWMFSQNKNNIKVFDNGDRGICADGSDNRRIGISPGFEEYEWSRNGVVIPNSNTNDLIVSIAGDYRVRHKRKEFYFSGQSVWSDWSAPVTIYYKAISSLVTSISPVGSIALPSLDGKTTVELKAAGTFTKYLWSTGQTTSSITVSEVGTYTVKVSEAGKCAGPSSNGITVTINGVGPVAPTALAGTALNESSIKLTWSDVSSDESGYEIYRATVSGGPYTLAGITAANATTFEDTKLKHFTNYYYKIRGYNNNGGSGYSPEIQVKTIKDITPPTAPQNLVASEKTLSGALLSWTASEDLSGIKRYEVYKNGVKLANVVYTSTTYRVTGLNKDSIYLFYVKAVDNANLISSESNQATVATMSTGVNYAYYQGSWSVLPNFSALTPAKTGIVTNFSISPRTRNDNVGFQFDGFINITTAGSYTFFTSSDDGSKLYIGNPSVAGNPLVQIVNNDGLHGSQERSGVITLPVGKHPIRVTYFERTGGELLEVRYQGPGIAKTIIPGTVLTTGKAALPVAPATVSNLVATAAGYTKINLTWTDNSANETGFEIYRAPTSTGVYSLIFRTAANVVSYADNALVQNTGYSYKIKTVGGTGESAFSSTVTATTWMIPPIPAVPANLTATATSPSSIVLTWNDSNNESKYLLQRAVGTNGTFAVLDSFNQNTITYTNTGLASNTIYKYRIAAKNDGGVSAYSSVAIDTTFKLIPAAPSNVHAVIKSAAKAEVSWTDNSSNENGFYVERSKDGISFVQVGSLEANTTTLNDVFPVDSVLYYRVRAYSFNDGPSDYSSILKVKVPKAPMAPNSGSWKLPAVTAIDNGGNSQLESALVNQQDYLSEITLAPSEVRTITVQLPVMSNDGMFIFNIKNNIANVAVTGAVSSNSTNGTDGTWNSLPSPYISEYEGNLQKFDIPQSAGGNWLRLSFANNAASSSILKELGMYQFSSTGRDNYILVLGASIEDALGGHTEFKNAIDAAFPGQGYEPVIFNLAVSGSNTGQLATEINNILARHPHASYAFVHQGGNNVTARRPLTYNDRNSFFIKDQFTDKMKVIAEALVNAGTIPVIARISFRDYKEAPLVNGGLNQELGSLPFDILLDDIIKNYNPEFYNFEERRGMVDLYQLTLNDQSILRASDGIHTATGQNGKYINYWINAALKYIYQGEQITPEPYTEVVPNIASKAATAVAFAEGTYKGVDVWNARILVEQLGDKNVRVPLVIRLEAIDTNFVPALPVAPSALTATALSTSQVELTWADNSDNEAGFEIYRSATVDGSYLKINTAAANSTSYTDGSLSSNSVYYYKLRAVNKGTSDFTEADSAKTFIDAAVNYAPTFTSIADQTVGETSTLVVPISSSDIDSETITLSIVGKPVFAVFTDSANGKGSLVLSPGPDHAGSYQVTINATDEDGGVSIETFLITVEDVVVSTETILYRVNAGAGTLVDPIVSWSEDTPTNPSPYFDLTGKNQVTAGTYFGVNNTDAPSEIFASYRYTNSTTLPIHYGFPVTNGNFKVKLYFISKVSAVGLRVFDINIEGVTQLDNYDVYADAGGAPVVKTFLLPVTDGTLDVELTREIGNQVISGIEIVQVGEDTDPTPVNRAPVITAIANQELNENSNLVLHLISSDADADAITLSASGLPSFATFIDSANGKGSLSIAPLTGNNGTYTITINANDGNGGSDSEVFTLTVNQVISTPQPVIYRVNAGGAAIADPVLNWELDDMTTPVSYFNTAGKNQITTGTYFGVNATDAPKDIFASYRYTNSTTLPLHYRFPVTSGNYRVKLYFMARVSGEGLRVFDVNIEGATIFDNFDAYAEAGSAPVQKVVDVTVTDGLLDIELLRGVNNPLINGIEIISLGGGAGARFASLIDLAPSNEESADNIQLSPVPVKDRLTINFNETAVERVDVTLLDVLGNLIYTNNYELNSGSVEIDLSELNLTHKAGFVKLDYDNGKTRTFKIIKE